MSRLSDHGAFLAPFNTCQHTALLRCSADTGHTGRHEKVERQVAGWKDKGPGGKMETELHVRSWSAVEDSFRAQNLPSESPPVEFSKFL